MKIDIISHSPRDFIIRSYFRYSWEEKTLLDDITVLGWRLKYFRGLLGVLFPVLPLICVVTLENFKYKK